MHAKRILPSFCLHVCVVFVAACIAVQLRNYYSYVIKNVDIGYIDYYYVMV